METIIILSKDEPDKIIIDMNKIENKGVDNFQFDSYQIRNLIWLFNFHDKNKASMDDKKIEYLNEEEIAKTLLFPEGENIINLDFFDKILESIDFLPDNVIFAPHYKHGGPDINEIKINQITPFNKQARQQGKKYTFSYWGTRIDDGDPNFNRNDPQQIIDKVIQLSYSFDKDYSKFFFEELISSLDELKSNQEYLSKCIKDPNDIDNFNNNLEKIIKHLRDVEKEYMKIIDLL